LKVRSSFLGIEIGGTKLQMVAGDDTAKILERRRFSVEASKGGAGIRGEIQSALPELLDRFKPEAIGVGFGGPVDWRTGRICCSHHVEGWSEFELGEWLRAKSGIPSAVDNDANVATLAEALHGVGAGFNPVFYTNSGTGVGGGLVVDGRIYHGAVPGEAEFGHLRLDRAGTIVEDRCSGRAVDGRIRTLKETEPDGVLARMIGDRPGGEARHLAGALEQGDPAARRILDETAEDLAFALSHVVHLFHPEAIVLGGGLSLIGEPWRAAVAAALPRLVMHAFATGPKVFLAANGEDVVPVGALALARAAVG
jgi:glucokinase